jgi:adenine phosphoribosyltransferase
VNQEQRTFLRQSIRTIADYPKPGIQFRDITTLLRDSSAFGISIEALASPWLDAGIDKVAGIEARGFILGGAVAHRLKAGFIPIRKRGKLPHETVRVAYSLEYGVDEMEMHRDAVRQGERVLLLDDLIATGGSRLSRNYRVGYGLGEGRKLSDILAELGQVVAVVVDGDVAFCFDGRHVERGFVGPGLAAHLGLVDRAREAREQRIPVAALVVDGHVPLRNRHLRGERDDERLRKHATRHAHMAAAFAEIT